MAASHKLESSLYCLKYRLQLQLQRFAHSFVKASSELGHKPMVAGKGHVDTSNWIKVHSRSLGLTLSMIPDSSRIVLKILQNEGYDAYLVGGCVRDLLLNKVPKDFDVITSANLGEITKKFHRAYIVGRKFPICRVHVRGSAIEVSSFETVARHATEKEDIHLTEMPEGYGVKDFLRWRNSLHRDFTINSLFYDPFAQRVYDYSSGMRDLRAMKLRTLVPAHLSFEEDCARILRGIRIAARLGLSFAKDTEKAICSLYASIMTLDKARLMMELNYMLSYGAAERSLIILKRFNILELLLPFHAAYLTERSSAQIPIMLMKLFFNLDSVTSCDQPCNSGLWVSLLAFHLALVNNPQDAIVVWTFSSLLYHGNWKEGVKAARELSARHVHFTPEILNSLDNVTDEELSQRVANFASMILDSIDMLTDPERLCVAMSRYPSSPSSGLVWISKNAGKELSAIFNVLINDIESLREERCYYNIDYNLLGKGYIPETRFALGKIIMDTMRSGVIYGRSKLETPKGKEKAKQGRTVLDDQKHQQKAKKEKLKMQTIDLEQKCVKKLEETPKGKERAKRGHSVLNDQKHQQKAKKEKLKKQTIDLEQKCVKKLEDILSCEDITQKRQQLKKVVVKDVKKLLSLQEEVTLKNDKVEAEVHCRAQTPKEILSVIGKVPKMASHHETQVPKEILGVLGKLKKQCMALATAPPPALTPALTPALAPALAPARIQSVLGKVPRLKIQRKEQIPKDAVNALSLSNIFKGDKYPTKKHDREEKKATVGDQPRDASIGAKRARKLSSIFK